MECTDHYEIWQWDALDVGETAPLAAERFAHRAAMTDAQATYRCHAHGPNYEFEVPHPFPPSSGAHADGTAHSGFLYANRLNAELPARRSIEWPRAK
jgi:hypothetical protein